jgi:hypothetical protein
VTIKHFAIAISLLALAGCASGPANSGAAMNGVDVWRNGPPSRPYRVLGNLGREADDTSATYRDEEGSITREAAKRGADAVIILNEVMTVSRIDAFGRPVMAPKVAAQLIKYQ